MIKDIIFGITNTANMKRTYTSNRTKKDEQQEYIGLAIVVIGFIAITIAFLFEAHII